MTGDPAASQTGLATRKRSRTLCTWGLHSLVLVVIAVVTTVYCVRKSLPPSTGSAPAVLLILDGSARGLHSAGLFMMGVFAVLYALVTTALMALAARRCWGPALMHACLLSVVALLIAAD